MKNKQWLKERAKKLGIKRQLRKKVAKEHLQKIRWLGMTLEKQEQGSDNPATEEREEKQIELSRE